MSDILSLKPQDLTVPQLHSYLLAAVAPRPIAFASTINKQGQVNLSPFSFFNVFSANPPIMIFSPARRGRDNTVKHTYLNVKEVDEVVINIVNHAMVEQMSLSSTEYEADIDEFVKSGLTAIDSNQVKPPRVAESPVAFECQVQQVLELGHEGGAGNLVMCKVLEMHIKKEFLLEGGSLDTTRLDLVARMGGNWYCRASGSALFEVPKPLATKGIGVDQLPHSAKQSSVLTGNNLGRLGNLESLPSPEELQEVAQSQDLVSLLENTPLEEHQTAVHKLAQKALEAQDNRRALALIILADQFT